MSTTFTIGYTRKTAKEFFTTLNHSIWRLVDVRLHNSSQLAGFTEGSDLAYLLDAVEGIEYVPDPGCSN